MKMYLNSFLTCSLILFALSLAVPTYGQEGPPTVIKEGTDGNFIDGSNDKVYTLNQINQLGCSNGTNDNHVFDIIVLDLKGNEVGIFNSQLKGFSPLEYVSKLSIPSGFYLIRYSNGTLFETIKVFKY